MHKPSPDIKIYNSLTEASPDGYAKPIEEFDDSEISHDHLANLQRMLEMLIDKRRMLAQDAIAYQMTFTGRSYDIAKIQPIIEAVQRALEHETQLAAKP